MALVTYGIFPLVFGGALVAGVLLLAGGMDPQLMIPAVIVPASTLIVLTERLHPHVPEWNRPKGDVITDIKHGIVSLLIVPEVIKALTFSALYAAGAFVAARIGMDLWPHDWHIAWQLILATVIAELGAYWTHRWMHEVPLLWRLHATHHTAARLYWLNAVRFHPLDTGFSYICEMIPLVLMGCPADVLALFVVVTALHGQFQHANIRMKLGPLNWIFSMAELHRWHHSTATEEGNNNYGTNLILWDIVFGTRFLPADREPPETIGVADLPNFPRGYLDQILSPFRWAETRERSQAAAAE